LKSNDQQTVVTQGQTIIIEPTNPQVIYVPQYNPTVVYGAPVAVYPGYTGADLAMTGLLAFGAGIAVGALISSSDGWGSSNWDCNWNGGNVSYNHNVYVSNSNNYRGWNGSSSNWNRYNRDWNRTNSSWNKYNSNWNNSRNYAKNDWSRSASNFDRIDRGYGSSGAWEHSNAFGGYRPGGDAWADSDRGRSSFGGSRGFGGYGGGRGFGGGGGRWRGGRR
jgi:hypothetical protein